ncbi:alpha/beta hydrolase [Streptomyces sp. NBC_00433]
MTEGRTTAGRIPAAGTANDVRELKQFVEVHAKAQQLSPKTYRPLLARITDDGEGTPGSWVYEWSRAGAEAEAAGRLLEASRYYNMARFPFVNGPARQEALDRCVAAFDAWRGTQKGIERLDVDLPAGRVRCWTSGLPAAGSEGRRLPLLLVTGGIVSVKEQWAPILVQATRLGVAGVVAEMPGVGENTLPYDEDSPAMLSAILDAVGERADTGQTYLVALSFSGHMALRAAAADPRIKGVITAGVPVSSFFSDREWQAQVPRVTVDTLAHLLGTAPGGVGDRVAGWGLADAELGALDVPVACLWSRRDEIIPSADPRALLRSVRRLDLVDNDDVHGSPSHLLETRVWVLLSLLRMLGVRDVKRLVFGALWRALRLAGRRRGN